jgi:hypothetical protein
MKPIRSKFTDKTQFGQILVGNYGQMWLLSAIKSNIIYCP